MNEYEITLPITGYATMVVEAASEDEALEKAFENVTIDHIEAWEAITTITEGNALYAMHPWSAEVTDMGPVDD